MEDVWGSCCRTWRTGHWPSLCGSSDSAQARAACHHPCVKSAVAWQDRPLVKGQGVIIEPEAHKKRFNREPSLSASSGVQNQLEDESESLYVVLFSSNKLAPGFPSLHLRGDMGLFRAKMDVLALPVWHPKALSHMIPHIKSWCGRQIPRPRRLYIRANVRYGFLDGAAQSPIDRYKSSVCLCVSVSSYWDKNTGQHVQECVRHIMCVMNDLMAMTWTKLQNTTHTLKIHESCGGFLSAAGMSGYINQTHPCWCNTF